MASNPVRRAYCGRALMPNGLPVGAQLVAKHHDDRRLSRPRAGPTNA